MGKGIHYLLLEFWTRMGFNMKIAIQNKFALFVGYRIALDNKGPIWFGDKDYRTYYCTPEIDRCFGRAGNSCSTAIKQAWKEKNREGCMKLAGSAALSRAFEFAGVAPDISVKFLHYAESLGFVWTYDLAMRVGHDTDAMLALDPKDRDIQEKAHVMCLPDRIRALNGSLFETPHQASLLKACGYEYTTQELQAFQEFTWSYDTLGDWEGFRASLPESWKS
jgi:hypothetical protein